LGWGSFHHGERAQDLAGAWLRGVAGHEVADSLHRDPRGRPRLEHGDTGWSHAHERLLVAYAGHGRVGVDVERSVRRVDVLRLARRFFAHEETQALRALDADARQRDFLRMWCAKEAVLKAHGGGIAFGLDKVVFDTAGGVLRMRRCNPALGEVDDWSLHELAPEPGYLAVLAATARDLGMPAA